MGFLQILNGSLRTDDEDREAKRREQLKEQEESLRELQDSSGLRDEVSERIWTTLKDDSMRMNQDPVAVVEAQLKDMGPGTMFLRNFALGGKQALSGEPLRNIRELLYERELVKQATEQDLQAQMQKAQLQALTSLLGQEAQLEGGLTSQVGAFGTAQERNRARDPALPDLLSPEDQTLKGLEVAQAQTDLAQSRVDLQQSQESPLVKAPTTPDAARQQIYFQQHQRGELTEEEWLRKINQDDAREAALKGKSATDGGWKIDKRSEGTYRTKIEGNRTVAERVGPPTLTASDKSTISALNDQAGRVNSMIQEIQAIRARGEASFEKKFVLGTDIFDKANAVLPDWLNRFTGTGLTESQQRIVRMHRGLVAAAVRAFTGAQATDREREFIESTLPRLFYSDGAYERGLRQMQALLKARAFATRFGISPEEIDFLKMEQIMSAGVKDEGAILHGSMVNPDNWEQNVEQRSGTTLYDFYRIR